MKYTTCLLILVAPYLSGCVSMLTHLNWSDDFVIKHASANAAVLTCADKNLMPLGNAYAFSHALTDIYSVSVYNKALYEQTFARVKSETIANASAANCDFINTKATELIPAMRAKFAEISSQRGADLLAMGNTLSQMRPATYSEVYIPAPAPVTFGQMNETRRFLVHTPSKNFQCLINSSGFAYCN
jgi:hypothetical protein